MILDNINISWPSYPIKTLITKIYFIVCLDQDDMDFFQQYYQDIENQILKKSLDHDRYERIDCYNKRDFLNSLNKILKETYRYQKKLGYSNPIFPLIHFKTNSSKTDGIKINATDFVSAPVFYEKIEQINHVSKNNIFILNNNCHGSQLLLSIQAKRNNQDLNTSSQTWSTVMADNNIMIENIENNLYQFYQNLLIDNKIMEAITTYADNVKIQPYLCEFAFTRLIRNFTKKLTNSYHKNRLV